MIRIIHTALALVAMALVFIFMSLVGLIGYGLLRLFGASAAADRHLRRSGRTLSRGLIVAMGGRVHLEGVEKIPTHTGSICVISNHQSLFDVPLLVGYVPIWAGFVAKEELKRAPLLRQWMRAMGCVFIKRGSARSSIKMILDGVEKLKQGSPLVVFPEGTRNPSNKVRPFKAGSLKLATRAKAIILPITIKNTHMLWAKDHRVARQDIYITIHDPIDTAALSSEEEKQLTRRVEQVIGGDESGLSGQ